MAYHPQPIDTSNGALPDDIIALTELLARNTHENWSLLSMSEGWIYGKRRDEIKKEYPCLIPCEDLPEGKKLRPPNSDGNTEIDHSLFYEIKDKPGGL